MAMTPDILRQLQTLQAELTQPELTGASVPLQESAQVPALATTDADTTAQLRQLQIELGQVQGGVGPTGSSSFLGDVGTAISNVPRSAMGVAEGFANLITSPLETAETIGRIGLGGLDVLLGEESENAKLAKEAFKQSTRLLRDPRGTLVNDPVGALLDVAGIAGGVGLVGKAAGLSKFASKAGAIERAVNPINVAVKFTGMAARPVARRLKETAIARLASTTGAGQESLRKLVAAGKEGGTKEALAKNSFADPDMVRIAQETVKGVEDMKGLQQLRIDEALPRLELKDPNVPIDPHAVRTRIFKNLEETWDVKVNPKQNADGTLQLDMVTSNPIFEATSEQARLVGLVKVLENWQNDTNFMNAWKVEQALDGLIDKGINRDAFKRSNAILTNARKQIREELGNKVKGFDEMVKDYGELAEAITQITKHLGIKFTGLGEDLEFLGTTIPGKIDETMLTKMGNILNDRGAKNLQLRRKAVEMIDSAILERRLRDQGLRVDDRIRALREMGNDTPSDRLRVLEDMADQSGVERSDILTEIAATRMADEATIGIARVQSSRGLIGGALGAAGGAFGGGVGAGIGSAAGIALQRLLSNMTIRNPRAVGRFFLGLGATERQALNMQRLVQRVADSTPGKLVEEGITFAVALERLGDRSKEKVAADKLLGPLGI